MIDRPTTLADRAAQLVWPRLGSNMPPPVTVAEDAARFEALLARCPVGGVVLFNGDARATPEALARLQEAAPFPLLVGSDVERGVGQQIRGATVFPHARAFAALGEAAEAALEEAARITAREALACGLHLTFAPVADVNRERRNPIIATRAFGDDAATAARLVRAYVRGCRAEGLLSVAKHFPGHGGTREDSHEALPVMPDDRATLEAADLPPFRAAIDEGAEGMMTAHVVFPALDPSGTPATASRPILVDLLRDALGFGGVVVTDSLLMGAIRADDGAEGAQAARLVAAGVDVLLDPPDPEAAVAGLVAAVESGRLGADRIEEAFGRVWALKEAFASRHGANAFREPPHLGAGEGVGAAAHAAHAEQVARRAVTVEGAAERLPIPPERAAADGLLVVLLRPHRSRLDPPEQPLGAALRAAYPSVDYVEAGPEMTEADVGALLARAGPVKHVVAAMVVKPAAWHAFGLRPVQQRFVEALTAQRPAVVAVLGSPAGLDPYPEAAVRVCTFSDVPASQRALAAVLAGRA